MKAKLTLEDGTEFNVTVDESELKKKTSKRWQPEENKTYSFISHLGYIQSDIWEDDDIDKWRYSQRNIFRTPEEAEQHLAYLKARAAILDHADEVNEGWVPDWKNDYPKYYIEYNHSNIIFGDSRFNIAVNYKRQHPGCIYYKTKRDARDAINKVGDAYLTVLGVK